MKLIDLYLESILDFSHKGLDKQIFNYPDIDFSTFDINASTVNKPNLRIDILNEIYTRLSPISNLVPVLKMWLVGGILTPQYTNTSDLDVTVFINKNACPTAEMEEKINKIRTAINNKPVSDKNLHVINYFIKYVDNADEIEEYKSHFDNIIEIDSNNLIKYTSASFSNEVLDVEKISRKYVDLFGEIEKSVLAIQHTLVILKKQLEISGIDYLVYSKEDIKNIDNQINKTWKTCVDNIITFTNNMYVLWFTRKQLFSIVDSNTGNYSHINIIYKWLEYFNYVGMFFAANTFIKDYQLLKTDKLNFTDIISKDNNIYDNNKYDYFYNNIINKLSSIFS